MKWKILELRAQGKTYKEICEELGCSKSTVAYYCGEGQKEKTLDRQRVRRNNKIINRIDKFKARKPSNGKYLLRDSWTTTKHSLQKRIRYFQARTTDRKIFDFTNVEFTYADFVNVYGDTTKCYLTGRDIDLNQPESYRLDHVQPVAKGGDNSLDNLGIVCPQANAAKSDMTIEEFVQLCIDTLLNFGIIEESNNGSEEDGNLRPLDG